MKYINKIIIKYFVLINLFLFPMLSYSAKIPPALTFPSGNISLRPIPNPIYGVTLDSIGKLPQIIESLKALTHTPTARIVFDEFVPAADYLDATRQIYSVSYIMGEILDSQYVKQYSLERYKSRTIEYLNTLGSIVDIWEIGNEVNGEWLGDPKSIIDKIKTAYDLVKQRGGRTALTLYYNEGCWEKSSHEMFAWAQKNVPANMKQGLDYVFISYYEQDCNGLRPNWPTVFDRLGVMFPYSKIGFGEVGTSDKNAKEAYLKRYYKMKIKNPNYVGGYFWWYFKKDMVPKTMPLWSILNNAIQ